MNSKASKRPKNTQPNRSVYVIGFPWRDNGVTKEEGFVVDATARPGSRRGLPLVSRFLPTREHTNQHHIPAPHHECKNTRHRDSAPTPHTAERCVLF